MFVSALVMLHRNNTNYIDEIEQVKGLSKKNIAVQ